MYYEENPKRKRAPRRRRPGCLGRLLRWALLLLVLYVGFRLVVDNLGAINLLRGGGEALSVNASLPGGYTNVLLLGCDREKDGSPGRSDTIIVASIGSDGQIKLCSLMRDTMVDMGDKGEHKLNAAYKLGGGELAMRTVNAAFGLNITKYAAVDFSGFAQVIDSMGGIELNISKDEMNAVNSALSKAYKKKRVFNGVLMTPLDEYGKNIHLSGTHALIFSRIRSIDSDFKRAERHRIVLQAILKKMRAQKNPVVYARLLAAVTACTETNMSALEMGTMGLRVLMGGDIAQTRMPPEGAYRQRIEGGIWMIRPNLEACRQAIRDFIYGAT